LVSPSRPIEHRSPTVRPGHPLQDGSVLLMRKRCPADRVLERHDVKLSTEVSP
jgi:hypothetical protein